MMRLQRYSFKTSYKKGKSLYLADTLSRAALPDQVGAKVTGSRYSELNYHTKMNTTCKDTEVRLRDTTKDDPSLARLHTMIVNGWPNERQQVVKELQQYWNFRDELTAQNGIIYKGQQILIPQSMQADMLAKIHINHLGAESNIRSHEKSCFGLE